MNGKRYRGPRGLWSFATATAVLLLAGLAGGVHAQGTPSGGSASAMLPSVPPAVMGLPSGGDGVVVASRQGPGAVQEGLQPAAQAELAELAK